MDASRLNISDKRSARYSIFLLFAIMAIYALSSPVLAEDMVLNIGVDSTTYMAGENITVVGFAYIGQYFVNDVNVTISLVDSESVTVMENTETTHMFGFFFTVLKAPAVAGEYDVVVTILNTTAITPITITVPVSVIEIAEMRTELVGDSFVVSSFGTPEDNSVTVNPLMMNPKAAVYTYNTEQYYVVLENTTDTYDRLYIDDDSDFTSNERYFEEGSTVKIGDDKYSIWYIDPKGDFVIFAERIKHVFESPDTQSNLLVLALDSDSDPISDQEIIMDLIDAEGNIESSDVSIGQTGEFGILNTPLQLSQVPGTHTMIFNDGLATDSYRIEVFGLKVSVVDASGNPIYKVAPGDTIFMNALVFGQDGTLIIEGLEKTEAKVSGHKTLEKFILTPDADGVFTESYTIPTDVKGKFSVQFKFMYQETQEVRMIRFEVENHDLKMYQISADFSIANSFAPGQENAVIISGKDTKDKKHIKLYDMTDGCNASKITVDSIYDRTDDDVFDGEYRTSSISDYMAEKGMSNTIRNRLKNDYGDRSCVIIFNTPETGGIYRLVSSVTLDDEIKTTSTSFRVDDVYLDIEQVSFDGNNNIVVPGSRVYFEVTATDALTGEVIPAENIISADIVTVTVSDTKDIVTENMVDIEIDTTYSADTALVSFIANDSIAGYHSVEFRIDVNVIREGTEKTVDATDYSSFREQMYTVKVTLEEPDRIYEGTTDNVNMNVEVIGFSSVTEGLEVSVETILSKKTGKKINSDSSCTITMDNNCTMIIESPKSGWAQGGYSVKLDIDDQKEYTYGWFR